ncbi:unnamed protein product [Leuciscus chuanchicus]
MQDVANYSCMEIAARLSMTVGYGSALRSWKPCGGIWVCKLSSADVSELLSGTLSQHSPSNHYTKRTHTLEMTSPCGKQLYKLHSA